MASMLHGLNTKWDIYAHLPHDTDWSVDSYKKIKTVETIEDIIITYNNIPDTMVTNCMLFLMKEGVKPVWEDPSNREGGCFSYKVNNNVVEEVWRNLNYTLVGESITEERDLYEKITGLSLSPKKNFCIIKIWLSDCEITDSSYITEIDGLSNEGVLFKKHVPED